jgi:hypothetical protein
MKPPLATNAAVRKSLREAEEKRMREAYLAQPDSAADADDWANPEEWEPSSSAIKKDLAHGWTQIDTDRKVR